MKNLVLGLIILALLGAAVYYLYDRYLIEEFSEAIVNENIPDVVPEKVRKDALEIKTKLNEKSDKIVTYLHQHQITLEEFNEVIDNIEYYEAKKFLERVDGNHFADGNEAFNFVKQNFDLGNIPLENFRDDFVDNYDSGKLKEALRYFREHEDQMKVLFPVAKETLKKMLREKYPDDETIPDSH